MASLQWVVSKVTVYFLDDQAGKAAHAWALDVLYCTYCTVQCRVNFMVMLDYRYCRMGLQ